MSRVDHIVARRQEASRPIRPSQKLREIRDPETGKTHHGRLPRHSQGSTWWRDRFANLVERRLPDGTYKPRDVPPKAIAARRDTPEMLPRPKGMTRQTQRRLFREACKFAGVDWRAVKKKLP